MAVKACNRFFDLGLGLGALFGGLVLFSPLFGHAKDTPVLLPGTNPQAPPPAPPVEVRKQEGVPGPSDGRLSIYSIGQPTDEEQLYLEYLNRSRANPSAEGALLASTTDPDVLSAYAYFGVDLALMQSQFNAINSNAAPLAMNAQLMAAARVHSGDMFTNQYQSHTGTDGSNPGQRITAQGYNWQTWGENIFAYAYSTFYGYAGLNVDWGPGTGGMQVPPGHRYNIHNATFREIGVGVVDGVNGSVGPQIVTQDFATKQSDTPIITGVVYYDFNGNNFYDPGEGIGGVTVTVNGSSYYAVTADSGGYAIPVTTNGNYTVTFSAPGLTTTQRIATVSSLRNVKTDLVPVYSPPTVSGPNPAFINQSNLYSFTAVAGATSYDWEQAQLAAYTAIEGAENGLGNVTVISSPGYSVQSTDLAASGSYSFHLAHPPDPSNPDDQFVTLNAVFRGATNSQLNFAKLLGYATSGQIARAQISTNTGSSWQDLWSQAGTGGSGDVSFSSINASLAAYAGKLFQIRFAYDYTSGSYYPQTTSGVGFYFDNIAVTNAEQLLNRATNSTPTNSFCFVPSAATNYSLRVRAHINTRTLDWGPLYSVAATTPPPLIQLTNGPVINGTQLQADFTVANYRAGMTFQLWMAPSPAGTWALDSSASFQTLVANSKFRVTTSTGGALKNFYRIKGLY